MASITFLCSLALLVLLQVPASYAEDPDVDIGEDAAEDPDPEIDSGAVQRVLQMTRGLLRKREATSEQQAILDQHIKMRKGVSPTASNMLKMSWSSEAAANAQRWAEGCSMRHSSRDERTISTSGCGENIYMSSNERPWEQAVQAWYDEVKDFKHGVGSVNGGVVGHYTQVVWYKSNQLGCGKAYCPNARYKYFYVCQYCPPGNFGGNTHPYNIGKPCADCPDACDDGFCTNPCPYKDKYTNCPSLTEKYGCSHRTIGSWCPATCKCKSEII